MLMTRKGIRERERRVERWEFIHEYLLDHPCVHCGETDPVVLDFHHVRGRKKFDVSRAITAGYSKETILKEIAKCNVVCANDHRRHTAKQQGWKILKWVGKRKEG